MHREAKDKFGGRNPMVPLQILRRELQCLELHTASTVARVDDPHETLPLSRRPDGHQVCRRSTARIPGHSGGGVSPYHLRACAGNGWYGKQNLISA